MTNPQTWLRGLLISVCFSTLVACGDEEATNEEILQTKICIVDEEDENDNDDCGNLLIGLTDADGDFLNYSVNVTAIELTRRDGTQVSVMTTPQTVNFVDYVELTELALAATIPAGVYTDGQITLDYSNADIQVEKDGIAVAANMVDDNQQPLVSQTLQLKLDSNNQLIISRGRAAMLTLDFNLAASHSVDLTTEPVTVTTEAYIMAEVDPLESKEFRVRGPLISVNEVDSFFRLALRPFHRRAGRFGGTNVFVNSETNFEIDGVAYIGEQGLAQMSTLAQATATKTIGVYSRDQRRFTATTVMAGSSVPGFDKDAMTGVIVARDGNQLTAHGVSLIRTDGSVTYRDRMTINVADSTHVSKPRRLDQSLSIADLSVGQAITVLGDINVDAESNDQAVTMDATEGAVRMRLTFASGHSIAQQGSDLTLDLQGLQGRLPSAYDFSGTGIDASFDADPQAYEVSAENLMLSEISNGSPIRVAGFVNAFASAPVDFNALTVIDYANARSHLLLNWPDSDELLAFTEITSQSLTVNLVVEGDQGFYKLIQGGIKTDLLSLDSNLIIQPKETRGLYTIKTGDSVIAFSNFADFSSMLQNKIDAGELIDGMHSVGGFNLETGVFSVSRLATKFK